MTNEQTDLNLQDGMFRQHAKYQAAKASENIQAIMFVVQLWRLLVRFMSYPGYIMLRRNFGERFLPTRIIIASSFLCMLVAMAAQSTIGIIIGIGILLSACLHRIKVIRRNRRQEMWHSYDDGKPILVDKFPNYAEDIEEYGEPCLVMTLGFLIAAADGDRSLIAASPVEFLLSSAFGIYVIAVGFAMLLQANKLKRDARNLYLDARDSQIDNQAFAAIQDRDMQDAEVDALHTQAGIAHAV